MPRVTSSRIEPGTGQIVFPVEETETEIVPRPQAPAGATISQSDTGGETGNFPSSDLDVLYTTVGSGVPPLEVTGAETVNLLIRTLRAGSNVAISVNVAGEIVISSTASPPDDDDTGGSLVADGFDLVLGDVSTKGDGSWTPGAVLFSNDLPISEAMDRMNELLSLLVPSPPPELTSRPLSVPSVGSQPLLSAGIVPDNTGATFAGTAGSAVIRIVASNVTITSLDDVGPGNTGTIEVLVNGVERGSRVLTGDDNGTHGALLLSDQKAFPPSQPGFWFSIDVGAAAAVDPGWNRIRLRHSGNSPALTNEVFFVRDAMTSTPVISAASLSQEAAGSLSHSSSVPHYGSGASVRVELSIANLSGETYYGGGDVLTIGGTNGILNAQNFGYSTLGIATPLARNTTNPTAITPVVALINGSGHTSGGVTAIARNVNGPSPSTAVSQTIILIKSGAAGARIDEMSVPVNNLGTGSGNAVRVNLPSGDTPSGTPIAWSSTAALPAHEAAVVAGILSHNVIDYSSGHLPVGPNLSTGRDGAQYVTFAFTRSAVSQFRLAITGSYTGVWIKLPGVSDDSGISPNSLGGWWNARAPYSGAGVPGRAGDTTAGCASGAVMNGSGTFTITFGTQSSTNAIGNVILVRIRLNATQSVTALSFSN